MTQGPTRVMCMEHDQMRNSLAQLQRFLNAGELEQCEGILEGMLILIQQHNTKEENILYPLCDAHITSSHPQLLSQIQTLLN